MKRFEVIDELNSNLRLYSASKPLKRFGNKGDGGYVMQDDLCESDVFISAGIANDVSWDFEVLNESGSDLVIQIDPNIGPNPPQNDPRVIFIPKSLAVSNSSNSVTLENLVEKISPFKNIILKVDIEGAEWDILGELDVETLGRFREIVIEFHWLHSLLEPEIDKAKLEVFKKLNFQHRLIHLHANNWGSFKIIENRPIPDVIECTYILDETKNLKPKYAIEDEFDIPNHPGRPEIILKFGT